MRMPLNPRKASDTIEASLGLEKAIVTPLKRKTAADVEKEKKAKKKPAAKKKAK